MTAPVILDERFDKAGNLVEVIWNSSQSTEMEMLVAIREAQNRMPPGPQRFAMARSDVGSTSAPVEYGPYLIFDGEKPMALNVNGKVNRVSAAQGRALAVLLASRGKPISSETLIEAVYPDPDKQPISGLSMIYGIMHRLRDQFPDLIDPHMYMIRSGR